MNLEQYEDVNAFLERLGFEDLSDSEGQLLFAMLSKANSIEEFKKDIETLLAMNKALIFSYKTVSIENMMKINQSIDHNLISELFIFYDEIRNRAKDETTCLKEFKKVIYNIFKSNTEANKIIEKETIDSMNKVVVLKNNLYLAMLDVEDADKVFNNCVKRTQSFLQQCDAYNLVSLISCLKNNFSFSNEEIIELSKKCATFFVFSSACKVKKLNKTVYAFRKYIVDRLVMTGEDFAASKLEELDIKNILMSSASIASIKPETMNKTLKFLMGSKVGDLIKTRNEELAAIKGNFTPNELARIYNKSLSSLSVSVDKIVDVCDNISREFNQLYKTSIDVSNLINGRNFSSLAVLRKEDYSRESTKMSHILNMLSEFFPAEDMERILRRNFSFLTASREEVRRSLAEAILNSSNMEELRKNILKKVRSNFGKNEGTYVEVERKEVYDLPKVEKVGINDFNGDELEDILAKLDINPNDINEWKEKWKDKLKDKKEDKLEKEKKALESEETRKELETILGILGVFNTIFDDDVVSIRGVVENFILARDKLNNAKERYDTIITTREITPENRVLCDKIEKKIEEVTKLVHDREIEIVKPYEEQMKGLNKELEIINKNKEAYKENVNKLYEINNNLDYLGVSADSLIEEKKFIEHALDVIEKSKQRYINNGQREKTVTSLFDRFVKELLIDLKVWDMGIDSEREAMYSYNAFMKIMADKGYGPAGKYVTEFFANKEIDYKEYRKTLTEEQRQVADTMCKIMDEYIRENFEIFSDIYRCFALFNKKLSFDDVRHGLYVLSAFINNRQQEFLQKVELYNKKRFYEVAIDKIDIDGIKEEEKKFQKLIEENLKIIELIKGNKVR